MQSKIHTYEGTQIDIYWDQKRCIHAAECANRLGTVFDSKKRPWIEPNNGEADQIAEAIHHCPSGALHYTRKDGGASEPTPVENTILINENGPYYVRGNVRVLNGAGDEILADTRIALCRCGGSQNKPICDNSHKDAGFTAPSGLTNPKVNDFFMDETGLIIQAAANGPLLLTGNFALLDSEGTSIFQGKKAALCRCGNSNNKPFCDGTHKKVGFTAE
jgi:CDGSH-type Zn-finger protein/uncharacterized Fe-S cluster protein YjdI